MVALGLGGREGSGVGRGLLGLSLGVGGAQDVSWGSPVGCLRVTTHP